MRLVNPDLRVFFLLGFGLLGLGPLSGCPDRPAGAPASSEPHRCHLVRRIPENPRLAELVDGQFVPLELTCDRVRCEFSGALREGDQLHFVHPRWDWVAEKRVTARSEPLAGSGLLGLREGDALVLYDARKKVVHNLSVPRAALVGAVGLHRWGDSIYTVIARREEPIRSFVLVPGSSPPPPGTVPFGDQAGTVQHDGEVLTVRWRDGRVSSKPARGRLRDAVALKDGVVVRLSRPDVLHFFGATEGEADGRVCTHLRTDGEQVICSVPKLGLRRVAPGVSSTWSGEHNDLRGQPLPAGTRRTMTRIASRVGAFYAIEELQDDTCQIRSRVYRGVALTPVVEVEGALLLPGIKQDGTLQAVRAEVSLVPFGD